ncbi:MAG: murein biosynthesis integral membrane protein MurJ [Thioclava marina]|uniref:murein biosynthesis integral membrane protein MurJ n=1 Tax=Thioclava marina TaxID=1915077 RepID=UPI0019C86148|nr:MULTISPECIES: murein biosynthesis integral membrane protein MurJ [Thioclava]MBC7147278.1 murein biosynthesis integral membrane protein MurJ [Thioclava marina]MBD3803790.1 murein biosynthesis integral membrane protein MurJ [Thioclava sp.]
MKPIRLVRGFMTVGGWTMASRVLGFARDMMIAAFLGAGPVAEAFLVAFSLPNLFRRFFAEGAFNTAFIPIFSKKLEGGEDAQGFAREAMGGLASVLIVLTLIASAAMPWLVLAMASGFASDERFEIATTYGRIAFPYILFISLGALLSGVLNAAGHFAAAAAAPVLLNVTFVIAMLLADHFGLPVGDALAWSVPLAGVAQLALVWVAAWRTGFRIIPARPRLSPDMKRLIRIAIPAMLAGGVVQINLLVGRQVASHFDGAIAWLNYADRLYQLPLGVVGIAIGVVLLPDLSRRLRARDVAGSRYSFSRAGEFALLLTVGPAVALLVAAQPIVSVLFERGQFTHDDTIATAWATAIYGLGLPAFVLQKVLQPLYFARENTRTPFNYALVAMVVNAVLAIGLSPFIGYLAAACGTTFAAWAMVGQLWLGSRSMGEAAHFDHRFHRRLPRIVVSALVMGAAIWVVTWAAPGLFTVPGLRALALLGLVLFGMVVYFGTAIAIGAMHMADLRGAVRKGPGGA